MDEQKDRRHRGEGQGKRRVEVAGGGGRATSHEFDPAYWERHWVDAGAETGRGELPVNPYLPAETKDLRVGDALDAGCGKGTEAIWLAQRGWQVTGADVSGTALAVAAARAQAAGVAGRLKWNQADLMTWTPDRTWDLVVTSYAHAAAGQLAFYRRISAWVAPRGTLLIVGHLHGSHAGAHSPRDGEEHGSGSGHQEHPEHATATADDIVDLFAGPEWQVESRYENTRTVAAGGAPVELNDVVVRLRRS